MVTDQEIARINELAHKKMLSGLTDEELAEQQNLRQIYLDSIRQNVRAQLSGIENTADQKDDQIKPS